MHQKRLFILLTLVGLGFFLISFNGNEIRINQPQYHHKDIIGGIELPKGYNDLFGGSGVCITCHSAMEGISGQIYSITDDWRSTMMANAGKDPLWRAKVSHEILVNPALQEIIEDKCTKCHSPTGNKNAHYLGQDFYSIAEMVEDPLALDGVQCTVCHQIPFTSLGLFSGEFDIGKYQDIWGPYEDPFPNPMIAHTGYTPVYSNHINDSRLCASCHSLLTPTVDLNGVPTGNEFVEQAIYHEWENSMYSEFNISCQSCHIPRIADPVAISTMPPWLEERTPFGLHHFAGANAFMQNILKDNALALGVTAESSHFDSTIMRSLILLQDRAMELNIEEVNRDDEFLSVDVSLQNQTGHKFPAGFPSRRTFIELYAVTAVNDTLFHSGRMNENFDLINENTDYESHFDVINNEDQVQVYEIVMGDVNGDPTTILLYAAAPIKDNRLPPMGFSTAHPNYDTVLVAGVATIDPDFNLNNGEEGSGKDIVHYQIPINGYSGEILVKAKVWYQTMPYKWLQSMFSHSSAEIDLFKSMYEDADKHPLLVSEKVLTSQATGNERMIGEPGINIYPNPTTGRVYIQNTHTPIDQIKVYSVDGKLLKQYDFHIDRENPYIDMPSKGNIFYVYLSGLSYVIAKKVLVM